MPSLEELQKKIQGRVFYRNANLSAKTIERNINLRAESTDETTPKNSEKHTFVLISTDNATERFDWWNGEIFIEELDLKGADYSQLRTFFMDHNPSVENAIGKIDNKREESGELLADVTYASDDSSQLVKLKYDEEILTDVSIGYRIDEIVETKNKDAPNHILVTKYSIVELSAVWKGADSGAVQIKSDEEIKPLGDESIRRSLEFYQKRQKLNNGRI